MGGVFEDVVPCWEIDHHRGYSAVDEHDVFNRMGSYRRYPRRITLHIKAIEEAALLLAEKIPHYDHNASGPLALNLAVMVFLHKIGQALYYTKLGFTKERDIAELNLRAQHFTLTAIEAFGPQARPLFDLLVGTLQLTGNGLSDAGPTTWSQCQINYRRIDFRHSDLEVTPISKRKIGYRFELDPETEQEESMEQSLKIDPSEVQSRQT